MSTESLMAGESSSEIRALNRFGRRVEAAMFLEVAGRSGAFRAETVDISRTGVLLYVADDAFVPEEAAANMILYSERVEEEFGDGLEVRLGSGLHFEAEVVRVARRDDAGDGPMLMACRFATPMSDEEWSSLGFLEEECGGLGPDEVTEALAAVSELPAADRRDRSRAGVSHAVEILSAYAAYRAVAINVSVDGVLLEMTDPAFFAGPAGADRLQVCTDRLAVQFGNGIRIRFREADVAVEGKIVRVGEKKRDGGATVVVGCQFEVPLRAAACRRLGIDLPEAATGENADYRLQTRVRDLLARARACGATDLHLKASSPPRVRIGAALVSLDSEALDGVEVDAMARDLMGAGHAARFAESGFTRAVVALPGMGRFRVHALRNRGSAALAIRCLPPHAPALDDLRVPPQVRSFAALGSGLVLIAGGARSGRTTLLASLVDEVNRTRPCHVVTLDSTVEFAHEEIAAHITQRDLDEEEIPFAEALRQTLHFDADVIAVGALRDADSLDAALEAAESGRLVLAAVAGGAGDDVRTSVLRLVSAAVRETQSERLEQSLRGTVMVAIDHDRAGQPQMICHVQCETRGEPA